MQRFYLKNTLLKNSLIIDSKDLVHQILVVLRSRVGDYFVFFDGINFVDKVYRLQVITKNALEFKFVEDRDKLDEKGDITLYQALPNKIEKLEYIIQKGTEVGYTRFVFFRSERSQKLMISDNKKTRLESIIVEATEQSGRNIVPELYILDKLDFTLLNKEETLFFHTLDLNSKRLNELFPPFVKAPSLSLGQTRASGVLYNEKGSFHGNINLIVGPEGGLSEFEVQYFEKLGFTKVFLGESVLRCETVSGVVGFYINMNKNF